MSKKVRLWRLGIIGDCPQTSVIPTKAAVEKLRSIIDGFKDDEVIDVLWGPELDCSIVSEVPTKRLEIVIGKTTSVALSSIVEAMNNSKAELISIHIESVVHLT